MGSALAQEKAPPELAVEQIEKVSITATKRQTLLQETPVAVTAVTQKELDRAQVKDLAGLQVMVPGLHVEQHGDSGGVHVFLRGIGSTNHTELGDPAVSFHIDGVYSPRPQGATVLMYDLSHVEVLRGPQGTLFGRNATAGLVNVVTAQPLLKQYAASGSVVFGDYNRIGLQAMANIPIDDTFALRLAAITDKHDGYVSFQERSNVMPGADKYMSQDQVGARATGLWRPNADISATLAAEYYRDSGSGNVTLFQQPRAGQDRYSALIDTPGVLNQENVGYRGRIDWRFVDGMELSYIGAWSKLTRQNASDNDAGTLPGFKQEHRTEWSRFTSYSHELQLKSTGSGRLEWIVGAFLIKEDNAIRFDIDISQAAGATLGSGPIVVTPRLPSDTAWAMSFIQPQRTLDSKAAFGQASYAITDAFKGTLGVRYTDESKEDVGGRNWVCPEFGATLATGGRLIGPGGPVTAATCGSAYAPGTWPGGGANDAYTEDDATTWLGRLEYKFNPDMLGYATYSEGFKSGGLSDGGRRHKPEYLTNYEVGLKTELWNRSLSLNLAAFYMKYDDMQVSAVERLPSGQQQLVTSNAAKSTISGIEAEFSWLITPRDRLVGNVAWLDAKFDDFLTCDSALVDCGNPANFVNLAGSKLRHAPKFSATAMYEHEFVLNGGGRIIPRLQVHYQTESFLSEFNTTPPSSVVAGSFEGARRQDAYTTLDLSLRYQSPKAQWILEAFVLNATDEAVKTDAAFVNSTWVAFYNNPRTYGARLSYRF
ncbi:TonB-dependent receptor [Usitatibacter palustris]|uniref:TonB-dependent receptor n=1 Tax=Usitatibacter palustris TaxID=2732487 RepID=UPI00148811E7|nr:TonB-dependent receptor [Usitatibacter palustris]